MPKSTNSPAPIFSVFFALKGLVVSLNSEGLFCGELKFQEPTGTQGVPDCCAFPVSSIQSLSSLVTFQEASDLTYLPLI